MWPLFSVSATQDPSGGQPSPAQLRLIGLALLLGATTFAAVAVALPFLGASTPVDPSDAAHESSLGTLRLLSLANLGLGLSATVVALLMGARAARQPERAAVFQIVRWASLEGAALFGIVIVLLGGTFGHLPGATLFYLNLTPLAVFAAVLVADVSSPLDGAGT